MAKFYGKRPARPDSVKLKFSSYANELYLPAPPRVFGHYGNPPLNFGMLANDRCADCVWAGAAHETMIWTHRAGSGAPARFDDHSVITDYAELTGYDPAKPETDQGTDMQAAAAYRQKVGIADAAGNRHKIEAYVSLHPGDGYQLALASYLFGAVGIGLRMPDFAEDQFDAERSWTFQPNAKMNDGHYTPVVGRNSQGDFLLVTWGRLHAMSPTFYAAYCDEAIVYLTTENLAYGISPEGFNFAQLRADLAAITSAKEA